MILFLDTISPSPKFFVYKNNRMHSYTHILDKNISKISDSIISKYLFLSKRHSLDNKLEKLIICTGPGSYTSLRVGISFMYGLSLAKSIPLFGISNTSLLNYKIKKKEKNKTLIFISSLNNQNFLCIPKKNNKDKYILEKIDGNLFNNIDLKKFSYCVANFSVQNDLKKILMNNLKLKIYKCEDILNENIIKKMRKKNIIKPIYVSNNHILN